MDVVRHLRKTGALAVAAVMVAILADGYILGPMNWSRTAADREPVFCRCIPHDGGGCWYRGITYTIFTSFEEMRFDSRMPWVHSESREGPRPTRIRQSTSVDSTN